MKVEWNWGSQELCWPGPRSCPVLGLILALPCKVAEGDEHLVGRSELIPGDRRALE